MDDGFAQDREIRLEDGETAQLLNRGESGRAMMTSTSATNSDPGAAYGGYNMHRKGLKLAAVSLLFASSSALSATPEDGESQAISAGDFVSESNRVFGNWNRGEAEIVVMVLTGRNKRTFTAGTIGEDGSFAFRLPESVGTSVPVSSYSRRCTNQQNEVLDGSEVKLAYVGLYARQNGEAIGGLIPAIPVRAAYNMNVGNINNGNLGKYYVWVYADGDTSVQINCRKKVDMTDGKEVQYKDIEVEDRFNFQFKKGWNLVRAEVLDSIWVGLTKHYLEREWTVVSDFPDNVKWVFRATAD